MSAGVTLIVVLAAAVIAVIIGSKFNVNMGVLALVFGAMIAGFALGIKPSVFYTYWPVGTMIQLVGITFFFGFVGETGAVDYLANGVLYLIRGKVKLLPFVFPLLSCVLGLLGISPLAYNTLLLPLVASLCVCTNIHPVFLFLCYGCGIPCGLASPLGVAGIVGGGIFTGIVGPETASAIMPRVYINNAIFCLVMFVIIYVIFRGWRIQVTAEKVEELTRKPAPATREQKTVLIIMVIAVLVLVVPGLIGLKTFSNATDIGWVYMLAGALCALLKLGDCRKILGSRVPWGIIVLVGGFATLLAVASNSGSIELLSHYITANVSTGLVAPLINLLAGIISVFSDAIGVVFPTFMPVGAQIIGGGAVSGTAVISAIIIGGMSTACAPLSTGGAQMIAYMPEKMGRTLFWCQLAVAFGGMLVSTLLCLVGVYG